MWTIILALDDHLTRLISVYYFWAGCEKDNVYSNKPRYLGDLRVRIIDVIELKNRITICICAKLNIKNPAAIGT